MTNREKVDYINEWLGENELLLALAEEAAELAQAALKLHRVRFCENPTPVTRAEATKHLNEEIGDTLLCWNVLVQRGEEENTFPWENDIVPLQQLKLDRWVRRLKEAEDHVEDKT